MEVQNFFPGIHQDHLRLLLPEHGPVRKALDALQVRPGGSTDSWRLCLYFTELLLKYEPTVASKAIGDFQTYNLNYLIIKLNGIGEPFLLEDSTVAYLIKRKNLATRHLPRDKEFDKLVELWEYNVKEKYF